VKIAISTSGKTMDSEMDLRFGRCEYFLIYDTERGKTKVVENQGESASGGAGIAASQQLIDEKVDAIITGSLGPNAFKLIDKAGIKAYKGEASSVKSILQKYKNNELEELKEAGPSHHSQGLRGGK